MACIGKRALGYCIAQRMAALNCLDLRDSAGMVSCNIYSCCLFMKQTCLKMCTLNRPHLFSQVSSLSDVQNMMCVFETGSCDPVFIGAITCLQTALLHAAKHNQHLMVADLIHLGANVNVRNKLGKTCLHLSAEKGYVRVLEVRAELPSPLF